PFRGEIRRRGVGVFLVGDVEEDQVLVVVGDRLGLGDSQSASVFVGAIGLAGQPQAVLFRVLDGVESGQAHGKALDDLRRWASTSTNAANGLPRDAVEFAAGPPTISGPFPGENR